MVLNEVPHGPVHWLAYLCRAATQCAWQNCLALRAASTSLCPCCMQKFHASALALYSSSLQACFEQSNVRQPPHSAHKHCTHLNPFCSTTSGTTTSIYKQSAAASSQRDQRTPRTGVCCFFGFARTMLLDALRRQDGVTRNILALSVDTAVSAVMQMSSRTTSAGTAAKL